MKKGRGALTEGRAAAELVAELEQSAIDMDPAVARVCFELAGIWMYLEHMRTEKHTMDDLRHYQNVRSPVSF